MCLSLNPYWGTCLEVVGGQSPLNPDITTIMIFLIVETLVQQWLGTVPWTTQMAPQIG